MQRDTTARDSIPLPPPLLGVAARQLARLDALIDAGRAARGAARSGSLFASRAGRALVNAAFDLFECDELYRLGEDVAHELEPERER